MTTSCYPDSLFIIGTQEVFFYLAKRPWSGSQFDASSFQNRNFKKQGIFLNGEEIVYLHKALCCQCASVLAILQSQKKKNL